MTEKWHVKHQINYKMMKTAKILSRKMYSNLCFSYNLKKKNFSTVQANIFPVIRVEAPRVLQKSCLLQMFG